MNKTLLPVIGALALVLSACGPERGHDLADMPDATAADSLLYYYAQLRAYEYWHKADTDTALRSPAERQKFLEGIKTGLDAVRKDDDNYNRGVRLGVRMALRMQELERSYGLKPDDDVLIESMANALQGDYEIPQLEYQDEFYRLLGRFEEKQRVKDRDAVRRNLTEVARDQQMAKIGDNLYYRLLKKGSGPNAHAGDVAYVAIDYRRDDGEDLAVPSPERVTVGAPGIPEVMTRAYERLNKGSIALFATTAEAVFASRTEIMGLRPTDVLLITITLNDITCNAEPAEELPASPGDQ